MSLILTSTTTVVILNDPSIITQGIIKNVTTVFFNDGADLLSDKGKNSYSLTCDGIEYQDTINKMFYINNMIDNQDVVTVTGFLDDSFNTSYLIHDLVFKQKEGESLIYYYTLILERIWDE